MLMILYLQRFALSHLSYRQINMFVLKPEPVKLYGGNRCSVFSLAPYFSDIAGMP